MYAEKSFFSTREIDEKTVPIVPTETKPLEKHGDPRGASINTAMPGRPRPWTPNKLHGGVWLVGRGEMFERFGGPGGIRTLDLFHAIVLESITYKHRRKKQKT